MDNITLGAALALARKLGADPELVTAAVEAWLDAHPEATTTVQDGSITKAKLDQILQGIVDDVPELKSDINSVDGEQKTTSGTSSKYINIAISAGDTFIFRNTGNGVVGTVKSQLNGANVEDVLANLAAHTDIEWTATAAADRFYIYFNSNSELIVFRKNSVAGRMYSLEETVGGYDAAIQQNTADILTVSGDVSGLESEITGDYSTRTKSGSGNEYIAYPIKDGETYVIKNTGTGVIGTIKTQANGANVEDVTANLAANTTIEWTAGDDADRFYLYFNAASSVEIYTKDTLYAEVVKLQNSSSEIAEDISNINNDIAGIDSDIGNYAENEKSSAGWVVFDYNIVSGTTYRIRTGAGIFGWIKTRDSGNHDVETIYQNCPANSDFTWTASDNAVKIYLYYNAASTFSIVENNSIRDTIIQNDILVNAKFENQASFSKDSGGNSYNVFPITKDHTYAICNNGPGMLGSMSTLTASNTSVQTIISGVATPPGGMVVFTATGDAAKVYVYYNTASAFAVYDLGAAKSNAELVSLSIAKGYSDIATYKVGETCVHNLRFYKCKTEISTPETWTEAHWELADAVTVAADSAKAESRAETITTPNYKTDAVATGAYISEDMSVVGNELWLFTQATAIGGTADGYISRLSLSDYSVMDGQMTHNLGHCGTTDYDADNDRMVICGADNGTADTPYLYIYSDVSDWAELQSVLYADVTVDRIDLSALAVAYSPVTYVAACWGPKILDGNKLLYVYGGGNWYLLLMGTGTTQLEMGSYTAASAGRYNGTYKVLNYWKYETHVPWDAYDDVMQGAVMHDGIVYTSNGHQAITLRKWQFHDNHVATCEQIRTPWINADGTESTAQGQGVDFQDGKKIVAISTGYIATLT